LLILGVVTAGYLAHMVQSDQIRHEFSDRLSAVADLKVDQITTWRSERRADARLFSADAAFASLAQASMRNPSPKELHQSLQQWLSPVLQDRDYDALTLFDVQDSVVLRMGTGAGFPRPGLALGAQRARESRTVEFTDLLLGDSAVGDRLEIFVPLFSAAARETVSVGVLNITIDPHKYLFPLLKERAPSSATAETYLVRREGDDVVYLSELRFQPGGGRQASPATRDTLRICARAIRGHSGIVEGIDYRGAPVLAAVRSVPGTSWFLVTKVDRQEIDASVNAKGWYVAPILVALLLVGLGAITSLWNRQRRELLRAEARSTDSLSASESRFQCLYELLSDALATVDMNGTLVEFNNEYARMMGYEPEELRRLSYRDYTPERWHQYEAKVITEQVLARGYSDVYEKEYRKKDGTVFPVELRTILVKGPDGQAQGMWAIVRDISERKAVERALVESEELFRTLISASPDAVSVAGANGTLEYFSQNSLELFGYTAQDQIVGRSIMEFVAPEDLPAAAANLQSVIARGRLDRVELTLLRRDGSRFIGEINGAVLKDAEGKPHQIVLITRDITERKRNEKALLAHQEQLHTLIAEAPLRIAMFDRDMRYLAASRHWVVEYGNGRDELTGLLHYDIFPDIPEAWKDAHRRGMAGERVSNENDLWARADGSKYWLRWAIVPWHDAHGEIGGIIITVEDLTEHKRAEQTLRESEARYRTLTEAAKDSIFIINRDDTIEFVNSAAATFLGRDPRDIVGHRTAELFPPSAGEEQVRAYRRVFESGEPGNDEMRIPMPWGDVWFDTSLVPLKDAEGRVSAVLGMARDITWRKRAEEGLLRSEERLRLLVESNEDIVIMQELSGRYAYLNAHAQYGIGVDSMIGKMPHEVHERATADAIMERLSRVLSTGRGMTSESDVTWDGKQYHFSDYCYPVRNAGGAIISVATISRNITAQREAGRQIQRLHAAIEQSGEIIFMTDQDGIITYVNPAFVHAYGYAPEECIGRSPRMLQEGMPGDPQPSQFGEGAGTGASRQEQVANMSKKGDRVIVDSSVNAVLGVAGEVLGFIAVQRDITEQMRTEVERKSLERQLIQAQKLESLGTLAGGIAHDFNNILGIILGHSTLLKRAVTNPVKFAKSLEAIEYATTRGAELVRQILTFARRTDVLIERIAINDTVTDLGKLIAETFPKSVVLSTALDPGLPAIEADRTQLHQTLLNLCVNARDAMPDGGTIAISTSHVHWREVRARIPDGGHSDYVCIAVADTGCGMNEETRRRIFEPFFTTKAVGKGTGLGLALVHGIVSSHGGAIDVESTPGEGTCFRLYFPVPVGTETSLTAPSALEVEARGGDEILLVVEDEEPLRQLLQSLLEARGYSVLATEDGESALRVYHRHRETIAAVITDYELPIMDGGKLFLQLQAMDPGVKFILASGYVDPEVRARLMAAGVKSFIQKPYHTTTVLREVRSVLDGA
jgi:PAS domain S-box-containing protein